ncbi:NAD(P)-dependent alcohol dehydrogenase [Thalassospira sp. TSL5-1]|uniref:NAD(P)-dependent alcohol dehydrogenase n=1 Tax=Thalassospira sp. TSL5-1 TaxID=1544451 RepID=UPI000938B72C|nr:NAD(P)-dependent alcohol dehydrogenase [Thalassospira sp. TSL5-1]OKH89617.1 hydroxyacid dehydrogenase [Thalassospira sp. TSL5-1]
MQVAAYGAKSATSDLEPLTIERRQTGAHDVAIEIDYCGVCHSDLHMARNDWGIAMYPVVPGHEIVGRVTDVGAHVKGFKPGDLVGVGCMVDSCQSCPSCEEGLEQYCENGMTGTYNGEDKVLGGQTFGGYSGKVVVNEKFVLRISDNLDTKAVAPLLCAGITTWSPLRQWNVKKGDKVGVVGLGGLGHMGVKFAAALGAHVVMITTSVAKGEDAKRLGAHEVLVSKDEDAMTAHAGSFDFLLNTIPVKHDLNPYIGLLKRDATMVIVGAVEPLEGFHGAGLILGRKRIAGSLIGGIKETQEMLDFCAEHNITSDVEMIDMATINTAYERMQKSDVKYRFVIDMKSLQAAVA